MLVAEVVQSRGCPRRTAAPSASRACSRCRRGRRRSCEPVWCAPTRSSRSSTTIARRPGRGAGARARSPGRRCRRRRPRGRSRRWASFSAMDACHERPRHRRHRLRRRRADPAPAGAPGTTVRAFARGPTRSPPGVEVVAGDAVAGAGSTRRSTGIDVAYYLIHSMEPRRPTRRRSPTRDRRAGGELRRGRARGRRAARRLPRRARARGQARLEPAPRAAASRSSRRCSTPRRSRVALRASIVIGARSRSFRFLVRLVERVPVHAAARLARPPHAADRRARRARLPRGRRDDRARARRALSLDIAGPDVVTYGELVERIRDALLVGRPPVRLGFNLTPRRQPRRRRDRRRGPSRSIGPLMEGLDGDLLPRDDRAAGAARRAPAPPRRGDRARAARLGGRRGAGGAIGSRRA